MKKIKNKYRIESTRLKKYDYSKSNAYFITIVTKERKHYFGRIENDKIQLSKIGKIALEEWYKTLEIRSDMNLELDAFVVMPNHIHGIIIIGENKYNTETIKIETEEKQEKAEYKNKFGRQSKNIASIIRGYKSAVTTKTRKIKTEFEWQANYHDRVIRNEKEYNRIKK